MTTVRSTTRPEEFALAGAPDQTDAIDAKWHSGGSRPEWCFLLEDEGRAIGRVAFSVEPTCPPEYLGDLPPEELFLFGLWLPWDDDPIAGGRSLIPEALRTIAGQVPDRLQVRTNPELHEDHVERVALFEALGMELLQEKEGFTWSDGGMPIAVPDRLVFAAVDDVGRGDYRDVLAGAGRDTLDRNDAWYRSHMDEGDWGSVFMRFLTDEDAPMWLEGRLPDGSPVGMVAVSAFDYQPDMATITFVGVLPAHRGNGYIDDLLAAGTAVAQRNGFATILSDVDTENTPMMAAMERAGHHPGARTWHVWHQVGSVARLVSPE